MHIYEGILSGTSGGNGVLLAGAVASAAGTALGLARLDYQRIPRVAVLSSAFFVASLIPLPLVGPATFHPTFNGLLGLILGWAAFPAILVALLLQALFFSVGGLTTLGLNTLVMALPGVACHYLFRAVVRHDSERIVFGGGFAAGATGILLGALLVGGALLAAGKQFEMFGYLFVFANLPLAVIEGLVTGSLVVLLRKVRPELLGAPLLVPSP